MTVGDQVGRIVGAPAGTTVMHQNVAVAEAVVLSCFRPYDPRRNRVVYERGNFPSVRYLYQAQPDLEVVVCEDDGAIVDAIDERTLLVPISHVLFKTGEIQDVEPIVRRAHEVGRARDPRLLPVGRHRPARRDRARRRLRGRRLGEVALRRTGKRAGCTSVPTSPRRSSRRSRAGRRTRRRSRSRRRCASPRARRGSSPGRPNVPAHFAATAGYDLIEEVGIERIRAQLVAPDAAPDRPRRRAPGSRSRSPRVGRPARRDGDRPTCPTSPAVHRELAERQILCDFRPDAGIRLGPHFFTSDDELCFAIDQIGEIVETGAYERHLGAVAQH